MNVGQVRVRRRDAGGVGAVGGVEHGEVIAEEAGGEMRCM